MRVGAGGVIEAPHDALEMTDIRKRSTCDEKLNHTIRHVQTAGWVRSSRVPKNSQKRHLIRRLMKYERFLMQKIIEEVHSDEPLDASSFEVETGKYALHRACISLYRLYSGLIHWKMNKNKIK